MLDYKEQSEKKQKEISDLAKIIQLRGGQFLTKEQKQEIENWENRLEFRLDELIAESKLKELDIKLDVYKEVLKVIKQNEPV